MLSREVIAERGRELAEVGFHKTTNQPNGKGKGNVLEIKDRPMVSDWWIQFQYGQRQGSISINRSNDEREKWLNCCSSRR